MFSLFSSLFFALIIFVFAKKIAIFQGNENAILGYQMSVVAIVFASLLSSFRGLYIGQENMFPTAISQVLEQVCKLVFGLGFAWCFSSVSVSFAVFGAFCGIALSELVALLFLALKTLHHKFYVSLEVPTQNIHFFSTHFAITFSSIIIPIISVVDSFVVVNLLKNYLSESVATSLFGLESGIITSLVNLPVAFAVAVSLSLLPSFSASVAKKNIQEISSNLQKIITILLAVLIPFCLAFIFFGKEILSVIYPSLQEDLLKSGIFLLQISAINVLFVSFLQVFVSVFQSLGKVKFCVFTMLFAGVAKVILEIVLVSNPQFNIFGMALANVLFYALSFGVVAIKLKSIISYQLPQKTLFVFLFASTLTSLGFFAVNVYFSSIWAKVFYAGVLGIICYVGTLLFFDVLEIKNWYKELRKK